MARSWPASSRCSPSTRVCYQEVKEGGSVALQNGMSEPRRTSKAFRDRQRPEYDRTLTTTLVADFATNQLDTLADLILEAARHRVEFSPRTQRMFCQCPRPGACLLRVLQTTFMAGDPL